MAPSLPLSTMLSAALVAFTVEFDNEFESRLPHRTALFGSSDPTVAKPLWLTSQPMWANVMQYVEPGGITSSELHSRSKTTHSQLPGLVRWGYLTCSADSDPTLMPTAAGLRARQVWRPLGGEIEQRWHDRFGVDDVQRLRRDLSALLASVDVDLPDYLPITSPTQNGKAERPSWRARDAPSVVEPDLSVLLAKTLQVFTLDFEQASRICLPISANTLRVLDSSGVRLRDLPALTGVSKEANAMCTGLLQRVGCLAIRPDSAASRGKVATLTPKGVKAQQKYHRVLKETEHMWRDRFGGRHIDAVRGGLQRLVGHALTAADCRLFEGLVPPGGCWRAKVRRPATLPHYPMVLHRGGYPDGS